MKENQCLPTQGPNCAFINGEEYLLNNDLVQVLSKDIDSEKLLDNIPVLISRVKELKNQYIKNNSASINQVFSMAPKVQMNLLLNFESYEVSTKNEDVYMPDEKIVTFNIGKLKMNFIGKLKITQDREDGKALPINKNVAPYSPYGIIESESKFYFIINYVLLLIIF